LLTAQHCYKSPGGWLYSSVTSLMRLLPLLLFWLPWGHPSAREWSPTRWQQV